MIFADVIAMKVAIPHWQGRISPVFDVARDVLLVDVGSGPEQTRSEVRLGGSSVIERTKQLVELNVDILICGAISKPLEAALAAAGVRVFSQTCGQVEQVLGAFITGKLYQDKFTMPGCCGLRRRGRRRSQRGRNG
jgi:predicted Fe-Mo cluster-binding NifX family protein